MRIWLMAARVRTLPAAVAPVLVGTALAGYFHVFHPLRFVAALIGAMFIQIGTNLSNDYSDARRGADTEDRLGPVRVTAGGLVPPRQVLIATYLTFGVAVLAGAYLIAVAGWQLLLVGAASILAGVLYTGGPRPYGYEGLGELFVFLFFGIVAVAGSYFVQVEHLDWEAFALAVPVGLIAAGLLVVNNVRDIDTDRRAGKRTLAVRLGRARTRVLFAADRLPGLPAHPGDLGVRAPGAVAVPPLADPPAGRARRPDRAQPHRRRVAQRRPGPDRRPPAGLLHAAGRRSPAQPVKLGSTWSGRVLRAPFVSAWGSVAIARSCWSALEDEDGHVGLGEAAPLADYHGVNVDDVLEALEACRDLLAPRPPGTARAELLAEWRRLAVLPGGRGDRHGPVGPRGSAAPAARVAAAGRARRRPGRGQLHDRRGRSGRCRGRGRRGARGRLSPA